MEKLFSSNPKILFIFITISLCFSILFTTKVECSRAEGALVGINWGRQTSHRLIPSMVVDLLLQNGIKHLKLFSPSDNVLQAFSGADITITVTMPNEGIPHLIFPGMAAYWLQERVRKYQNKNINIRNIHVGTEPFSTFYGNKTYDDVVEALRLVQDALVANGYQNVTATTPHFTDVLKLNITKPSQADFREDLKPKMVEFVRLLNRTGAPFVMNIFPISYAAERNWDIEFAFIDNKSNFTIKDNGLVYRNVFEFVYDCFVVAAAKAGAPNLKMTVGQIGWPTDGYPGANMTNAERYFKALLPFVTSTKGTPLRPGASIDAFIHSLADENLNRIEVGAFQRHWGVYRSNGEPKYKIDFTGRGQETFPTTAKGVVLMPKRWCVFNGNTRNLTMVKENFDLACGAADCTSLFPGGSCSHLDFNQNVSYAFNRYFQMKAQANGKGTSCEFDGLGVVVPDDPSVGTCLFPVEILAAEFADIGGMTKSGGRRRILCFGSSLFWYLILTFFLLQLI